MPLLVCLLVSYRTAKNASSFARSFWLPIKRTALFCFLDEPDNYLSLSEVKHFVMTLRRSFQAGGQLLVTSHNPEAVRAFSDENTFILSRRSHLEPTIVRLLSEAHVHGDLIEALIRSDRLYPPILSIASVF